MKSKLRNFIKAGIALAISALIAAPVAAHQTTGNLGPHTHGQTRTVQGERYTPGIWVDPDGCEHWVMDDGWEGYMTPKTDRNGIPSCPGRQSSMCGMMSSDALFATNSAQLSAAARQNLRSFFSQGRASSYIIVGHTDSRASDAYNLRLSQNRANSVAAVARSVGANVAEIRGEGERRPVASNATRAGMAKNRRVEIMCVN